MYFENIEESVRFILTINIFYPRGYFCGGILRLDFFSKVKLNGNFWKYKNLPGARRCAVFSSDDTLYNRHE